MISPKLAILVATFSLVGALTVPTTAFAQDDESQSASNNAAIVDESTNTLDVTSVFTKQEEDMNPPIVEDLLANILKQDEDDKAPIVEDLLANILEDVDAVAIGGQWRAVILTAYDYFLIASHPHHLLLYLSPQP